MDTILSKVASWESHAAGSDPLRVCLINIYLYAVIHNVNITGKGGWYCLTYANVLSKEKA